MNLRNVSFSLPPNLNKKFPAKFALFYPNTELVSRHFNPKIASMATKSQHNLMYKKIPVFLREMREKAGLTQRDIGKIINKPQSYIYNCETANRRVDITEFIVWSKACGVDAKTAFAKLLKEL
jgi:hypothetical protein